MWLRPLITIFLFYFFAVVQSSFLARFNAFGVPDLIFIFFFVLLFFSAGNSHRLGWEDIFVAITAGFLLDIFSYSYFGVSITLLLVIAILVKKIMGSLRERNDRYPLVYFASLFLIFNIAYYVSSGIFLYYFDPAHLVFALNYIILLQTLYNLFFAVLFFFIFKRFAGAYVKN